ncbi:WD40 repeat domain-containing protein [Aerosakkonema funiforme]|uniref:WD40 repeat domain-containing protein n=1 Tax=Aerosakkonema funiforme FACHB-1375 TaxID=2949571 RepID=A0A926VJB2_9CYAN|nr:WD40 repeat domain-containing protein [Aerosakkonema funiforme]MBD2184678.1 WD40 repeat domain-containing protein [Aerosakkonema funiforme FACHB-1375]
MDWTTPLRYQQADFVKRLSKQKALEPSMLNSEIRGCHSEMMVICGDELQTILETSQREADRIAKNPPPPPPEYNNWIDFQAQFQHDAYQYLIRERLVDAIMSARLDKLIKKVKIDPLSNIELNDEGSLRNESRFTYTLADYPTVSIQVHICDNESFTSLKKDKVRWLVTQSDIKTHKLFIFICSFFIATYHSRGRQIETLLAGFLPADQIKFSGPKTYLKPGDLLYAGGLRCYLESLNPANTPPEDRLLVPETIQQMPDRNPLITVVGGWRCLHTLIGHPDPIYSLAINPSGQILASGSRGEIRLWDMTTGKEICVLSEYPWMDSWQIDEVNSLAFSQDGQTLIGGGVDSTIKIWHIGAKDLIDILEDHKGAVRCVAFSPSGQTFASGGDDRKINLWNRRKREAFNSLSWGDSVPHSLAFSPNGQLLASGSYRKIKIWHLDEENVFGSPKAKLLHTITAHSHIVSAVLFTSVSANGMGKILISGSRDRTIKLWNIETAAMIRTLKGHTAAVFSVALCADGSTIASGSEDKTVRIWHLETGELLGTFTGHTEQVNAVIFTPDGQSLISASQDKTIKIWQRG